jgi:signal transduction histidine kinase
MFRLLRYFSVASLIAFVLVGLLVTVLYRRQAVKDVVALEQRKNLEITRFLQNNFSDEIQGLLAAQTEEVETIREPLEEAVKRQLQGSSVSKLEIFSAQGILVFAIEADGESHKDGQGHEELGEDKSDDEQIQEALVGQTDSELVPLGTVNDDGEVTDRNLIASYIPLFAKAGQHVVGVFEVYSDANALIGNIQNIQRRLAILLVGLLSGLYAILLFIVGRGQKILRWQHTQMQEQQDSLEQEREQLKQEIANRERIEQELSEANADLETSKQDLERSNQELEKFAYVASHDLQEPLRKVQTFADRLASKYTDKLGDDGKLYLERMQESTGRMRVLIQDLLAYSRVRGETKDFVTVDLNEVVGEVVSDLEVRLEQSGGRIEVGDLPALQGDPLQMRQVFQNLIGNALKFKQPDVAPEVKVSAKRVGDDYEISVKDNGIGFEQHYADRVFEVFQRLHGRSDYEGTGIGLAIVRKVMEKHGGSIRVESSPGQGSQFFLTLPGAKQEQAARVAEVVA